MADSTSTSAGGGIGLTSLLGVAFIVLKLCHVIDWSWWWVLAPFWIGAAIGVTVVLIAIVVLLISTWRDTK